MGEQTGVVLTQQGRHASWLELFFDLVAVAGIGTLAHLLEVDESGTGIAVYVIAFAAIWTIWACFTLYANIRGDAARTSTTRSDGRGA